MFVDKTRIFLQAGKGGDGCLSFRREKFVPRGGPDGGNGGKGGDIILETSSHLKTLLDFSRNPHYKAEDGLNGSGNNRYGANGSDLILKIPPGTVIYKDGNFLTDLIEPGEKFIVAKGGRGGRGNSSFKTSRTTAPRIREKGQPGETAILDLELKLIADIGIIGYPNAGKSTLLSKVSAARPKIDSYPFTTLSPNLGVANIGDESFVLADIPGLISGAHKGVGLGDEFLRHIERTKVLVHIIDIFGYEGKSAFENYISTNKELKLYDLNLSKKLQVIVANKIDLFGSDKLLKEFRKKLKNKKIFAISAIKGEGLRGILLEAKKILKKVKPAQAPKEIIKKFTVEPDFVIKRVDDYFYISGKKIEDLAAMTDMNEWEATRRFQNIIKKIGLESALKENGVKDGDTIKIGNYEFFYNE